GDEVDELHLADRPHPHVRGAGRGADEAGLADGRVDHPLLAEAIQQPVGDLERAAVRANVLAHAEDTGIALHLLEQTLADGLEVGGFSRHRAFPSWPAARVRPPRSEYPPGTRAPACRAGRRRRPPGSRAARVAATFPRCGWHRRSPPVPAHRWSRAR